jgi:hypothetical protein
MQRCLRMTAGLVLILSMTGRDAHAQWGYGGWGYGGWGGGGTTPQSAALQGASQFAMGAGVYNLKTAQANSINAQTAMMYNNYVASVTQESARMHAAKVNYDFAKNQSLYDAHQKQLRDNPGRREIENGDALNLAVSDLSDPRLGSSALRAANAPVPASLIAAVPFQVAADRVSFMLNDLRSSVKWPDVFSEDRFTSDKTTFDELVARIRKEGQDGDISPRSLRAAKAFVRDLTAKLEAQPLKDPDDQADARKFLTACTSILALLENPDIGPAMLELRKIQDTTIGCLLGFMHAYNLRFGAATTVKEREAYQRLFGILDQTRDQVLGEAKLDSKPPISADPRQATEFYQNMNRGR